MYYKEVNKKENIIYFIDEESKTIVAKYYPYDNALDIYDNEMLRAYTYDLRTGNTKDQEKAKLFFTKEVYTGKAVCNEKDVFDLKKGKKIAKYKAIFKYYNDRKRVIRNVADLCGDCIHEMYNKNNFVDSKILHISEILKDVIEGDGE